MSNYLKSFAINITDTVMSWLIDVAGKMWMQGV